MQRYMHNTKLSPVIHPDLSAHPALSSGPLAMNQSLRFFRRNTKNSGTETPLVLTATVMVTRASLCVGHCSDLLHTFLCYDYRWLLDQHSVHVINILALKFVFIIFFS